MRTHPVERVDALPRIDSNVANDVVALTSPPATLQSINIEVFIYFVTSRHYRSLTISVEWAGRGSARPYDRHHSHGESDRPHAVVYDHVPFRSPFASTDLWEPTNIPVWWSHCRRRDAKHFLDRLACPSKLGNDLLVC